VIPPQHDLQESLDRVTAILETIPNAIVSTDAAGRIEIFNLSAEPMFQYSAEEVIGQHISMLLPDLQSDQPIRVNDTVVLTAVRRGGVSFPVEFSVGEMNLAGRKLLACVIRDISAQIRAEEEAAIARDQLLQAEKLASLGELVAGVAHEINTPVGIGVTAASHLREQLDRFLVEYRAGALKRPTLERFLDNCDQATRILNTNLRRAAELIQSFKQVAVDQSSSERRQIDVAEYLDELMLSLRPQLKGTRLQTRISCERNLRVTTYPGAIAELLTNLVMNSIVHAYQADDAGSLSIEITRDGRNLRLVYADDGRGIPEDSLPRIFDPFYTTRRGAGSSGLGLHIVYNLVKKTLQGSIQCTSAPQQGTSFTITFPAALES